MDRIRNIIIKSFLAGFLIGISGTIYLSIDNKIIGSLLFSFGLMTIIIQKFHLYTGMIGYVRTSNELSLILLILFGNFIGTFLSALLIYISGIPISSAEICELKLSIPLLSILIRSIFCGIMMYLAVDGYKKKSDIYILAIPVMVFILSGFEHSIANMFYFSLANMWSMKSFIYILVMVIGNGIGALGIALMNDTSN